MEKYKSLVASLLFTFFFTLVLVSCQEESMLEESSNLGYVEFSTLIPTASEASNGRRDNTTADKLSHIVISIQNLHEDSLVNTQEIKLHNFNGSWISEQISLISGEYQITQFLVLDSMDNTLYASPKKGSELAYLVDEPLSIQFSVKADQVTKVITKVISTLEKQPADFGYTAFSFQIVETFDFLAGIFILNGTIDNYQLTSSHLLISAEEQILYDKELSAETNRITIKDHFENYQLVVSKNGYDTYEQIFSNQELKEYTDNSKGPLMVTLHQTSEVSNEIHLDSGLVAFYPFQGNAQDASTSGFHGTVQGPILTTDKQDSLNNAYSFDGYNDQIDVGDVDLQIQDKISVSAWILSDSIGTNLWITGKYNWIDDRGFFLSIPDGYARFSGRDQNNEFNTVSGNNKMISDGNWHHIVGICNKNIWQIWVDGELAGEINSYHSNVNLNTTDPLTIGYYYQGTGEGEHRHFKGKIDNVRIYNRILNSEEIKKAYDAYL